MITNTITNHHVKLQTTYNTQNQTTKNQQNIKKLASHSQPTNHRQKHKTPTKK
jgi:hypothetical protein